jgi:hypothetical protein
MKRPSVSLLLVLVLLVGVRVGQAGAMQALENARTLCGVLESQGVSTECRVNTGEYSVDARIPMAVAEARKFCWSARDALAKKQMDFEGRWKLRIFSPFSGEHPIAVCPLK